MSAPAASTRPRPGDEVDVTVDTLAYGGKGVGRLDGYVVFVQGALPGDRVRARVEKSKRAYAEARVVSVLQPSPDRIEPVADHPGAPWQVLPYERQLEVKASQVDEALRRLGRLDGFELEPIVPAVEQWRYRNKLEYSFGQGPEGELICGFHAPGRFDQIVSVGDMKLGSERSNELREQVLAVCRDAKLPAWDRRSRRCASASRPTDCGGRRPRAWGRAPAAASHSCWPATRSSRSTSASCGSSSARRRSSRPTPRWPSACTASPRSTPPSAAPSVSTTCTAASGRSP
jgi:predicted RNA-binding protein with TRAM domain